ncbi:MAG: alpha/beta hydrolase [Thermodesulfobacteriota bacterium]
MDGNRDFGSLVECAVDGTRIALIDSGCGEPVVLLHGYIGSHRTWRHQLPELVKDHRVVAPDWFGWGQSERNLQLDYGYDAEVERLLRLLDQLGIKACNLCGHDYGGFLALGMAIYHPERVLRLALLNTRGHSTFRPGWAMIFGAMSLFGRLPGSGCLARGLPLASLHRRSLAREVLKGIIGPEELEDYTGWMSSDPNGPRFLAKYFADYRVAARTDLADGLHRISCPTAIIWGERDQYLATRIATELANGISNATLCLSHRSGHFITEEQPEIVLEALQRLLAAPL